MASYLYNLIKKELNVEAFLPVLDGQNDQVLDTEYKLEKGTIYFDHIDLHFHCIHDSGDYWTEPQCEIIYSGCTLNSIIYVDVRGIESEIFDQKILTMIENKINKHYES